MSEFVHLHLHSEYSLLDGACRVSQIPKYAKKYGQSAVAVTDHGNLFGAVKFYNACKKEGVKPIIGCEVYVAPKTRFDRPEHDERAYHHLILLCKNNTGYQNLITLASLAYTEGFYMRPRIDLDLLEKHSEGLICLSACIAGYIPQAILNGEIEEAEKYALKMRDIFGADNYYLEVQDHGLSEDEIINPAIAQISERTGIPMAATNDVHYLSRSDAEAQALLMAIAMGKTVEENKSNAFATDQFYFRSTEEMESLFAAYKGAVDNTAKIADMCNVTLDFDHYIYPHVELGENIDPKEYLLSLCKKGLDERIASGDIDLSAIPRAEYEKRMEYELSVICPMGFAEYYLIVCDFVGFAKEHGISVGPGRGSGVASLVAYLVRITDVDPLKYDLLFETFLNAERVSMPDFDIDFQHLRRDEVFEYVRRKYGSECVSKIITFGTLAARAAIRDVGRALGMPYADVDAFVKKIPEKDPDDPTVKITLARAFELPEVRKIYDSSDEIKKLFDFAVKVEGIPRNMSTHASGVVISDRPISEYAPIAIAGNVPVTQYDMDSIAELGLLKFDFLGLRELTTIENCVAKIRDSEPDFDIAKIPLDDRATFDLLSRGATIGVFQLESEGMRRMLTRLKPDNINDVLLALALYRPGATGFINTLIENRNKGVKSIYPIAGMDEILKETYGCIVYTEQIIMILRAVAGYSFGKADTVNRAIKKKKRSVIEAERDNFIRGAVEKGASKSEAERLFKDIEGFANYGFKKSHASAYGLTSYRTAYLKTHYPAYYFASLMSTEFGDTDNIVKYINDAADFGIRLMVPDINESDTLFTVTKDGNIRYGLLALKNVGTNFAKSIVEERKSKPFAGFVDFAKRMSEYDSNKKQIESLIKAGAFDSLGHNRRTLLSNYEEIYDLIARKRRMELDGQMDIFAMQNDDSDFEIKDIAEFDIPVLLGYEKDVSGMYMSAHPLDAYSDTIAHLRHDDISDLTEADGENNRDHSKVTVVGTISKITVKNSRSGNMAFVTISDKTGSVEVIVFADLYSQSVAFLTSDNAIAVEGELSTRENETPKILARTIRPLKGMKAVPTDEPIKPERSAPVAAKNKKLYLRVESLDTPAWKRANAIINIFGGQTSVVVFETATGKYSSISNKGVTADEFVIGELREILGSDSVIYK